MNPLLLKTFSGQLHRARPGADTRFAREATQRAEALYIRDLRLDTHVGEVEGDADEKLPGELRRFDCRNNRLAERALRQDGS